MNKLLLKTSKPLCINVTDSEGKWNHSCYEVFFVRDRSCHLSKIFADINYGKNHINYAYEKPQYLPSLFEWVNADEWITEYKNKGEREICLIGNTA